MCLTAKHMFKPRMERIKPPSANAVLALAKECGVKSAILKAKSPSCGCGRIYNGCFRGELRPGYGVTAALLERNGIHVQTEE